MGGLHWACAHAVIAADFFITECGTAMPNYQRFILTDLAHSDLWVSEITLDSNAWPGCFPTPWRITKRTLRGGRRDGIDLIEVNNGPLCYQILPTRGMSLWRGQFRNIPLGWQAPIQGPVHPSFVNLLDRGGLGWLDGFDEWFVRCGLSSMGPPGIDPKTKEFLPLHGRIANQPAHYVEIRIHLEPPYEIQVIGHVQETTLFMNNWLLRTTYTTTPGSNRLIVHDEVENRSVREAELSLLYHINWGPPLLGEGSQILAPVANIMPKDARAAEGLATWDLYDGPTPGFAEQVYFCELATSAGGQTLAMLQGATHPMAAVIRWSKMELPYFVVWKNTADLTEGYVTGLEPALQLPNFRASERDANRLPLIAPGQTYRTTLAIELLDQADHVDETRHEIAQLTAG